MAEDSWLKCEREMFLRDYGSKEGLNDAKKKEAKKMLEKYNAYLVRALFGESPYVAQNLKESIIKYGESDDGKE
jgi:hypothetical protein